MTAAATLATLQAAGLALALTPTGGLAVRPASRLTNDLREIIRSSRADLVAYLSREAKAPARPDEAQTGQTGRETGHATEMGQTAQETAQSDQAAQTAQRAGISTETPAPHPSANPDRWAWPNGPAMNRAEVQTLTERLALFAARGLTVTDAERLAERLTQRDRQGDTRGVCSECRHLTGTGPGLWRCTDRAKGTDLAGLPLAAVFVHQQPHRCPSRKPAVAAPTAPTWAETAQSAPAAEGEL
jgi:hypothetical protein